MAMGKADRGSQRLVVENYSSARDRVVPGWPSSCSTKYVRGVRPMGPMVGHRVDIANCNSSFILQLEV